MSSKNNYFTLTFKILKPWYFCVKFTGNSMFLHKKIKIIGWEI